MNLKWAFALTALLACTDNARSKSFGGTMEIRVPCDQVVFDVTWKEVNFWYATQPATPGWEPQTKTFVEHSHFGLAEGEVKLIESKCN